MKLSFVLYFRSNNIFTAVIRSSWEASSNQLSIRSDFRTFPYINVFAPLISVQFCTFPYRDVFSTDFRTVAYSSADFRTILPFCGNVWKCAEILRNCTEISFQFFYGIPQNSAEKISVLRNSTEISWPGMSDVQYNWHKYLEAQGRCDELY